MSTLALISKPVVQRVFLLDAVTCLVMGVALLAGATKLAPLFGLPPNLLSIAGLLLLPSAAFIAWVATREERPYLGVLAVLAGNALWIVASVVVLLGVPVSPSALGLVFVGGQALGVLVFTLLEAGALRRWS